MYIKNEHCWSVSVRGGSWVGGKISRVLNRAGRVNNGSHKAYLKRGTSAATQYSVTTYLHSALLYSQPTYCIALIEWHLFNNNKRNTLSSDSVSIRTYIFKVTEGNNPCQPCPRSASGHVLPPHQNTQTSTLIIVRIKGWLEKRAIVFHSNLKA